MANDSSLTAEVVREKYSVLFRQGDESPDASEERAVTHDVHHRALSAARRVFLDMRASAEIGDDAFHRLEEDLDRVELGVAR